MKYHLGIDVGGTNIAAGVVDDKFNIVARNVVPTQPERPYEVVVADIVRAGRNCLAAAGATVLDIDYVGIGVPSTIDEKTMRVAYANNLSWRDRDVIGEFKKSWDIPVYLANDADSATYGESVAGIAKKFDKCIMLTLGTGVGGGLIIDRKLYYGCEPGHVTIVADGEKCTCGRLGCLEAYASVTALIRETIEVMRANPTSAMWELCGGETANVSGRTAFNAAKQGDQTGIAIVKQYIHYLAVGVSNLITLLRPEAVILGGGICNEGEYLFGPLRKQVRDMIYAPEVLGVPLILKASLGNDAGIIGTAFLGEM
ncbi:MAG: ROK family protein [Oscillospiraceae bacterium]